MLCAPKELNLDLPGHLPFLGETDDWKACVQRMSTPQQKHATGLDPA
jgi:hypothetical protein